MPRRRRSKPSVLRDRRAGRSARAAPSSAPRVGQHRPTGFYHRLGLLAAGLVLSTVPLAAQLGRLTLVKGEASLDDAQRRLVVQSWLPTSRGRILDRRGRVLAFDRAGYDVAVDFPVLDGSWARDRAARWARRAHRDEWAELTPERRTELIATYERAYAAHVDRGLSAIAEAAGIEPGEFRAMCAREVERVSAMHRSISSRTFERLIEEYRQRSGDPPPEKLDELKADAERPIAEQKSARTLLENVGDEAGFRLLRMADGQEVLFADQDAPGGPAAAGDTVPALPGLVVRQASDRVYPMDRLSVDVDLSTFPPPLRKEEVARVELFGVGSHILGAVRAGVYAEDALRREEALASTPWLAERSILERASGAIDRGRYFEGDVVGRLGVEASMEHLLRGLRGLRRENLHTGEVEETSALPGADVRLTLDAELQARTQAVMDPSLGLAKVQTWHKNVEKVDGVERQVVPVGTNLFGAAVVLDIATGHILAMVSTPTPPRDADYSVYGVRDAQVDLWKQVAQPDINRAIAKPYPPGSIAKAPVLAAAVAEDRYDLSERIHDTGHFFPGRTDVFRSWIYKQFGITHSEQLQRDPDAVDALMVSANVFFYTLAQRLGVPGVQRAYAEFAHLGTPWRLGLGPEWPGQVGGVDEQGSPTRLETWDVLLLGIGQGPVTWTPLHAAVAYATIARDGVMVEPRIIADGSPPRTRTVEISATTRRAILDGLWGAVNDEKFGTGCAINYGQGPAGEEWGRQRIFFIPGVGVWGKTGTATAPPVRVDPDGDGPRRPQTVLRGDHSWFVVLAGPEGGEPEICVAVVMDYAGSGGRVSGPITEQILRAALDLGYLRSTAPRFDAADRDAGGVVYEPAGSDADTIEPAPATDGGPVDEPADPAEPGA
jgi:cell division protein FtsI/penicillin-binding protein 2